VNATACHPAAGWPPPTLRSRPLLRSRRTPDGSCATLEDWFDPARLRDDYVPTGFAGYGIQRRAVPGHKFGLNISIDDKRALIAFLKTLWKRWKMRTMLALAIASTVAFGADNSLGTWNLNIEKSTYTPAPIPFKSVTIVREAFGDGVKVTTTGVRTDGRQINSTYRRNTMARSIPLLAPARPLTLFRRGK
jgi:hypothetical protein